MVNPSAPQLESIGGYREPRVPMYVASSYNEGEGGGKYEFPNHEQAILAPLIDQAIAHVPGLEDWLRTTKMAQWMSFIEERAGRVQLATT